MKASDEIELVAPVVDKEPGEWMYFREDGSEGKRQIDLVLVYEIPSVDEMKAMNTEEKEKEQLKAEKRRIFESNLREAGVEMEHEDAIANKVLSCLGGCYNLFYFHRHSMTVNPSSVSERPC